MKKIYLIFGILLFSLILVSSQSFTYQTRNEGKNIGTSKINELMQITNYCSTGDCTYANLTSIKTPNGVVETYGILMTKKGQDFNYSYVPQEAGTYHFNTCSDPGGTVVCDSDTFEVSGGNLVFFILGFILFFGLALYGLKIDHVWIGLLGCFGLAMLGIYTSLNGIGLDKNTLTSVISYVTIAIGVGLGFQNLRDITFL